MFISLCLETINEKGFMNGRSVVLLAAGILLVLILTQSIVLHGPSGNHTALALSGSVAVYSDLRCTQPVNAVDWGVLSPGMVKNVVVYVQNEGASALVLVLSAMNWTPAEADGCLGFSWNHYDFKLIPGQVGEVILTLTVAQQLNITNFNFNILFKGLDDFPTDVNHDGKVDDKDVSLVLRSLGSYPGCQPPLLWNPACDINGDGKVNFKDLAMVSADLGQTMNWTSSD
jgi:hypothetical protein